ncbi:hypothetical protein E3N88_36478 [Mikania micrantha]|uniref:STICHEL DnaA-N-like alpha-beta domain-containing protein n=1 Tax=Mikania micrantha TaxID=192012 RepID=A0A5N6M4D6_9ASTR|nr:hypothetical protein E3N88_36478 [Mikania micrantha]
MISRAKNMIDSVLELIIWDFGRSFEYRLMLSSAGLIRLPRTEMEMAKLDVTGKPATEDVHIITTLKKMTFEFVEEGKWSTEVEAIKLKYSGWRYTSKRIQSKAKQAQLAKAKAERDINPNFLDTLSANVRLRVDVLKDLPFICHFKFYMVPDDNTLRRRRRLQREKIEDINERTSKFQASLKATPQFFEPQGELELAPPIVSADESLKRLVLSQCNQNNGCESEMLKDKEALELIWSRAMELCNSISLSYLLKRHGRLAFDSSVVELKFHHPDYASKADKSWK